MATKVTNYSHVWALTGAPERRLAEAPNGDQWLCTQQGGKAKFFRSTDQGATWAWSSYSDFSLHQWGSPLAFFIDADGYAHVAWANWESSPQKIRYARGRPSSSGSGWHWDHKALTPAAGRIGKDVDVTAFRHGTGWSVWVSWPLLEIGHRLSRLSVSTSNAITVEQTVIDPGSSAGNYPFSGVTFAHTGDGVTPTASPHILLSTASMRNLVGGGAPATRLHRGQYQSGSWTWSSSSVLLDSVAAAGSTLVSVWDGALLCAAWYANSDGAQISFATWPGTGAATRNDPPALTGVTEVTGISLSHDPVTDDLFLFTHDRHDGDIRWTRLVRSTGLWTAWATAVSRTATYPQDNQVQALRHPMFGNIDFVYTTSTVADGESGTLWHARVATLSRTPAAPALQEPANGALGDYDAGATFTWAYSPAGPGDAQGAWQLRRKQGATTEWWNAGSQAWSLTEVWNTGSAQKATFPEGRWPNGLTYAWTVRTRSATGAESPYAAERTVISTVAPVVDVTAPVGLVYGESTPLVEWVVTSLDPQRDYEVRIVEAAAGIDPANPGPSVWTSGVVTSTVARSVRVDTSLDPSKAYRAYVRVVSTAGLSSAWDYSDFGLSLTPPAGPLVSAVDDLAWGSDIPRARLEISGRSNYMDPDQAMGQSGWEALVNSTVSAQPEDLTEMLEPSLLIQTTGAGTASARSALGSPPPVPPDLPQPLGPLSFPVRERGSYTALGHFRASLAARAGRVSIEWYDSDEGGGVLLETTVGDQVVLDTGSYTMAALSATAPVGAKLARVLPEVLGAAGSEAFYVTRISFHPGLVQEWQPGGFSSTQTVRIERSDDDGATWSTVIERAKTDYWQRAVEYDRSLPLGREVKYRAFTDVDLGTGSVLTSGTSPVATTRVDTEAWVVRDLDDVDGEVFAYVVSHDRKDTEEISAYWTVGREYPVIDSEGWQSPTGTLEVWVPRSQVDGTVELLRRTKALLVQSPLGETFSIRVPRREYTVEAIADRMITVEYIEVR